MKAGILNSKARFQDCYKDAGAQAIRMACEALETRRLLAAGDPDAVFGNNGLVNLNSPNGFFFAEDVAIQPSDGKVVVVGSTPVLSNVVARYHLDGSVDTSFGNNGYYTWDSSHMFAVSAVAIQNDGGIVMVGRLGTPGWVVLGKLTSAGQPDNSFSDDGIVQLFVSSDSGFGVDVAIQNDFKIVVLGTAVTGSFPSRNADFIFARYHPNGSIDTSFGDSGVKIVGFGGEDNAAALAIDYNGNPATNPWWGTIAAVGRSITGVIDLESHFAVTRLTPGGQPDSTFDSDGRLFADFAGTSDVYGRGVTIQPGGKIVAAGTLTIADQYDVGLIRLNPNGSSDTTFGPNANGRVVTDLDGDDQVLDIATGYIGGLIVSAWRQPPGPTLNRMALLAYTRDGLVDNRFSQDGVFEWTNTSTNPVGGLAVTGSGITPVRRIVAATGRTMVKLVDVGSVVSVGSFDPYAFEQGQNPATFLVTRTERLSTPERVFIFPGGVAHPPQRPPLSQRDYLGTNITFVSPFDGASYVDIPANETFTVVTITPEDDVRAEGDEPATFSIINDGRYDIGTNPSTTLVIRDNDVTGGPIVMENTFNFQTSPLRVAFRFSQDVSNSIDPNDFVVTGPPNMPSHLFNYDDVSNTATLTFSENLPDGNYSARAIAAGIVNIGGEPMPADQVLSFFAFAGDANRDRAVDIGDFSIVAANFNKPGNFAQGDFNYSGQIEIGDFAILASKFNTSLPATGGLPRQLFAQTPSSAPAFSSRAIDLIGEEA